MELSQLPKNREMKKFKYFDTELQSILTQFHGMKAYQGNLSGYAPECHQSAGEHSGEKS